MKLWLISIITGLAIFSNNCSNLTKVRAIFQAGVNEKQLENMIEICETSNCDKIIPYHAAAIMKKAEFTWSPFDKLANFKKGKKMLENYISINPKSIEAKYIRYLTQKKAPNFLGYNKNTTEDYNFIVKNIKTSGIDRKYQAIILTHIKEIKNE